MDTLRRKFVGFFYRSNPTENSNVQPGEEPNTRDVVDLMQQQHPQDVQEQEETSRAFLLTTADIPLENTQGVQHFVEHHVANISYETEFVDFINRNAPQGFAPKLQSMLPYMGVSFVTWPTYWLWRGYNWRTRRQTQRIGFYIQRTFQHAKLMQVAILGLGLLMATSARASSEPLDIHEVSYKPKRTSNIE